MNYIKDPLLEPYEIQLESGCYNLLVNYTPPKGNPYKKALSYHNSLISCLNSYLKYSLADKSYDSIESFINTIDQKQKMFTDIITKIEKLNNEKTESSI